MRIETTRFVAVPQGQYLMGYSCLSSILFGVIGIIAGAATRNWRVGASFAVLSGLPGCSVCWAHCPWGGLFVPKFDSPIPKTPSTGSSVASPTTQLEKTLTDHHGRTLAVQVVRQDNDLSHHRVTSMAIRSQPRPSGRERSLSAPPYLRHRDHEFSALSAGADVSPEGEGDDDELPFLK